MTDLDRFAAFLAREAAGYNSPPATPADAMWPGVEGRLGASHPGPGVRVGDADSGLDGEVGGGAGGAGSPIFEALAYNASPPVPREEMWTRIEAAWALRRSAVGKGAGPVARAGRRWLAPPGRKGWVAAVAAAASLVLGIALGRGTRPEVPGERATPRAGSESVEMAVQAEPSSTVTEEHHEATADPGEPVRTASIAGGIEAPVEAPGGGEAETPVLMAVAVRGPPAAPLDAPGPGLDHAAAVPGPGLEGFPAGRTLRAGPDPESDFDYATAGHLGRAATLLTAFRTDRRTPASRQDLARWARELLAETRMYLGLSADTGSPVEHTLLEDLELVLIQIAGLGPGAPDFEWDLARESMERRGTLMRLRAASVAGET